MKRTLDDNVGELFRQAVGLEADTRLFDAKLVAMAAAVVAGCIAQFMPGAFIDNKRTLAVAVGVYFGLSFLLQLVAWFIERDYVFSSRATVRFAAWCGKLLLLDR